MNKTFKLLWAACMTTTVSLQAVVILVHTSNTKKQSINLYSSGPYYNTIAQEAKRIGSGHAIDSVQWLEYDMPQPQALLATYRIAGALKLAKKIIDYKAKGENVIVIGHSYGGQVAAGASVFLGDDPIDISQPILEELTKQTGKIFGIKKQIMAAKEEVEAYKKEKFGDKPLPQYWIQKLYTIGTPIDNELLKVNLNSVEYYVNLYSAGDLLITPAGVRLADYHPRAANFRVLIANEDPSHTILTSSPSIAAWILRIPEELRTNRTKGFAQFNYGKNGVMKFSSDPAVAPSYQVDTSIKLLGGRFMFVKTIPEKIIGQSGVQAAEEGIKKAARATAETAKAAGKAFAGAAGRPVYDRQEAIQLITRGVGQ